MNKADIRSQIKAQRLKLSVEEQALHSRAIAKIICAESFFKQAKSIALYLPVQGEVDTRWIAEEAKRSGKRCYLPVLSPEDHLHLCFMPFDESTQFVMNRFNIPEPKFDATQLIAPQDLDLVITPLVAFDKDCERLGMGLGFYDRTFAFLLTKPRAERPLLCGVAYGFQEVDSIQPQTWDVSLDYLVTESKLISRTP